MNWKDFNSFFVGRLKLLGIYNLINVNNLLRTLLIQKFIFSKNIETGAKKFRLMFNFLTLTKLNLETSNQFYHKA